MLRSWMVGGMLFVSSMVAVACASAGGGAHLASCDAEPGDSVFAAGGPVYHDCAVDKKASISSHPRIDFRSATPANTCFSADVQFVVGANGKPEAATARIVGTNNHDFAEAVLESLASWRYDPAMRNGVAVRQIVTAHESVVERLIAVRQGDVPHPPDHVTPC